MRLPISLLCLPLFAILTGCGTPANHRLNAPTIQINGLATPEETGTFTFRLINTNTVPLVVTETQHTLYLGDKQIGRIEDDEPIGVPALGGVDHTAALPTSLAQRIRTYTTHHPGEVRVSVESTFHVLLSNEDSIVLKNTGSGWVDPR